MAFADDYIDVATRIVEFRTLHPEGSLQPADPTCPYRVETIGDLTFVVYTAAAYRGPDDKRPGIGTAWERVPGLTNFTKNSELQNAETSAWGRAIVAALAGDTKRSVASADEVRNRQAERDADPGYISAPNVAAIRQKCTDADVAVSLVVAGATSGRTEDPAELFVTEIAAARDVLAELTSVSHRGEGSGSGSGTPAEPDPEPTLLDPSPSEPT